MSNVRSQFAGLVSAAPMAAYALSLVRRQELTSGVGSTSDIVILLLFTGFVEKLPGRPSGDRAGSGSHTYTHDPWPALS